jgi:hypothetical protein
MRDRWEGRNSAGRKKRGGEIGLLVATSVFKLLIKS